LLLVAVLAVALTVFALRARDVPRDAAAGSEAPLEPLPSVASEAAPRTVVVDLQTKPPGARIVIDGKDHGHTPARVELSAGGDALAVELTLAGYHAQQLSVVPDVDQRFVLTFERAGVPRARAQPKAKTAPAASGDSFGRFD
jgi:serine/threonine-protein kinase